MATERRLVDVTKLKYPEWKDKASCEFIEGYRQGKIDAICEVKALAPTVDAVEVVHSQWKYYHKQNIAVCKNCSFERDLSANFGRAVSCPNCGAKMDGGKTE